MDNNIKQQILERAKKIPIFQTLGFEILELDSGLCKVVVKREKKYDGIFESFHGGLLMTVADSISALTVLTMAGPDAPITTTDMNIRFLAPCRSDVTAIAKIIKYGKTMCPVAVDLFDEKGIKVAIAQVNYMILRK
jgi:uncharacterized protein (TIGR00369 family)